MLCDISWLELGGSWEASDMIMVLGKLGSTYLYSIVCTLLCFWWVSSQSSCVVVESLGIRLCLGQINPIHPIGNSLTLYTL